LPSKWLASKRPLAVANCDCWQSSPAINSAPHNHQGGFIVLGNLRLSVVVPTLLVAAGFVGCGGSGQLPPAIERLPGRWHGEMIVYEEELQGKLTPEQIAGLAKMQWDFEFRPDGSMTLSAANEQGQSAKSDGRWELVKQEGDLLTIKSTEQSGDAKQINFEFDGSDVMFTPVQTNVAELGAMRFTRMR
jgi:hypothetical protein